MLVEDPLFFMLPGTPVKDGRSSGMEGCALPFMLLLRE